MTPEELETFTAAMPLAGQLLEMAEENELELLIETAYAAWGRDSRVLPMVMANWYGWIVQRHGDRKVADAVASMTSQVSRAPVAHPASRLVFCQFMYALQDGSPARAQAAWDQLASLEQWEVAEEVISLVLSFVGYFLGWYDENGRRT